MSIPPLTGHFTEDIDRVMAALKDGGWDEQDVTAIRHAVLHWGPGAWTRVRRTRGPDGRSLEEIWARVAPTRQRLPKPHEYVRMRSVGRMGLVEEKLAHPATPYDALRFLALHVLDPRRIRGR